MANEFVTRTGLIVSGSTFLPAVTTASKGYILSFDDTTKQVYYMSTSSVTVTVPGSDTQVIYNNGGAFGAASNFVFSGSNVGIGTTSPSAKLTVKGSGTTSTTTAFKVENANASSSLIVKDDGQIQVSSTSVANPGYSFIDNTDTGLYMVGGTMGTVVDGQYSILYGADGPQLYSNTTNSITSANLLMAKIGSNHRMSIWMNGNNDFQFEAWQSGVGYSNNIILQEFGGNVGIGTTSPAEKLDVSGSIKISYPTGKLYAAATPSFYGEITPFNASGQMIFNVNYPEGNIIFQSGSVEVARFKDSKLGIGTSTPGAKLEVDGNSYTTGLRISDTTSHSTNLFQNGTVFNINSQFVGDSISIQPADYLSISTYSGSVVERVRVTNGGNVGIGTTNPQNNLHISGAASSDASNIRIDSTTQYGGLVIYENTTLRTILGYGNAGNIFSNAQTDSTALRAANYLHLGASSVATITINGSDNVGIGTTSPNAKLDVNGNVLVTGSLTVSGSSTFTNIGPAVFTGSITQNASTASFGGFVLVNTTTTPYTDDKLYIGSGNIILDNNRGYLQYTSGGGRATIIGLNSSNNLTVGQSNVNNGSLLLYGGTGYVSINAAASEVARFTTGGDVGIGTSSPTAKLDIRTDTGILIKGATSDTDGRVSIIPASGGRQYDLRNYGSSFGIKDASADVVRMFFHNNGNIGIANGTTTPTATLEVNGNVKATSFTGSFSGSVSAPGSTTQIVYNSGGALAADSGLVYSGSAVGIGTATPSSGTKLQVDGNIYSNNVGGNSFTLNSFGANYGFISTTANNTFSLGYGPSLGTLGTPVLTWNSSGNVGIGTTTPSTALTVVGAISSSGATFVGGNLSVGTTYNSFAANIAGTTYVIGASVWVNDGYGYANASSGNTGFFPSGSSDIRINSAGTTRMFIASGSGNVGIGTTSPLNLLHVSQASANTIFRLGNNASYDQFIYFNGGNDWSLGMDYSNSNAFVLSNASSIGTNDRLVVTTGGNVGIGTTAPGAKLDIVSTGAGTEGLRVDGTGGGFAFVVKAGSDYTSHIRAGATVGVNYFTTPPSNGLIVEGNVGIGTTSPISGQGTPLTLASSTGYVGLTLSGSGAYSHLWQLYASGDGSSSKFFGIYDSTNALYRLVTTSTGNVGIGTTSPGAKLTVYSDTTSDGILVDVLSKPRITLRDRGNSDTILGTGDYGLDDFFIDTYSGNALAIKGSTRNVGIGTTTPGEVLEVVGNIRANVSNGGGFMLTGASASGLVRAGATGLALRTNTTDRLTIDNSGNVGIGTTSPSAKLDVYRALQTDTITRANAAAYFWGADVGLAIGQYASGPYGTWLQSLKYDNNNSFPLSLNPSGGNVGIGTSNPLYNLEVSGSGYYGGNLTVAGTITAQKLNVQQVTSSVIYSSGSNVFGNSLANTQTFTGSLQVTGSTHYLLGNVGIGITSPTAKLHFGPGNWASDPGAKNYSGAAINTSGSDIATGRIFLQGYDFTGTDTVGINNETNRLVLFNYTDSRYLQIWDHTGDTYLAPAAGNVGIGTTSPYPSARLQVKTATDINVAIQTGTTNLSGIKINAFNDAGDTNIPLELNGSILSLKTGETERMHITSGGNVVINGTTAINPASNRGNLTINGTSAILNFGISNTESGYIFHNGTNLDIAQVLAQPLRFLTTNAERMRIDASGNVGIGTSSPVSKLHVVGDGDTVTLQKSNNVPALAFLGTSTNKAVIEGGDNFNFYTLGSSRIYISGSGNVGIGTTSPARKLDVNGTSVFRDFTSVFAGSGNIVSNITWLSTDSGLLNVYSGGSPTVQLNSNGVSYFNGGNVGIGTTNPNSGSLQIYKAADTNQLVLNGGSAYTNVYAGNFLGSLYLSTNYYYSGGHVSDDASKRSMEINMSTDEILFATMPAGSPGTRTRLITISGSQGFIGIGTSSPSQKLDVNGIINTTAGIIGNNSNNLYLSSNSSAGEISFWANQLNTRLMTILGSGNVGIGTATPVLPLQVSGRAQFGDTTSMASFTSAPIGIRTTGTESITLTHTAVQSWSMGVTSAGTFALRDIDTPTDRLVVTQAGNVGIGTTTPSTKLVVSGSHVSGQGMSTFKGSDYSIINLVAPAAGDGSNGYWGFRAQDPNFNELMWFGHVTSSTQSGFLVAPNFDTANSASFYVARSNGNVGIGTTNPIESLNIGNNGQLRFDGNASGKGIVASSNGSNQTFSITRQDGVNVGDLSISAYSGIGLTGNRLDSPAASSYHLYVNSSGNVGIGTTSPVQTLDVFKNTNSVNAISVRNPNTGISAHAGLYIGNDADNNSGGIVVFGSSSNYSSPYNPNGTYVYSNKPGGVAIVAESSAPVYIATNNNIRFYITSGGNVGIGTTSPTEKLHVAGTALIDNYLYLDSNEIWAKNGADLFVKADNKVYIQPAATTSTVFDTNGNVGIGTTSPTAKLQVVETSNSATTYPLIINNQNNQAGDGWGAGIKFSTSNPATGGNEANKWSSIEAFDVNNFGSNSGLSFTVSDTYAKTKAMVITRTGAVGIGTTSPNATFQIANTTSGNAFSMIGSNSKEFVSIAYLGYLRSRASDTNGANIHFADNGNTKRMEMAVGSTSMAWYSDAIASNFLYFYHSTGNVSIGTSNSSQRLQVSGSIAVENQGTTTIESTTFAGTLTSNTNIAFVPTGSFKAAFFDYYVASSSTNMRAGTVMAVHNNSTSRYTDTSTADIGNTAAVDFSTSVVGGNLVLTANISSGTWEIKTAYRAL